MKIFKNGEFISCGDINHLFSVLIEDNGKIVFTGNEIPEKFNQLDSIDMKGRCIIPSFYDTHMHFSSFALFHNGLDCRYAKDFEELSEVIQNYINANKDKKVILGFGCSSHTVLEKRLPERKDLDKITNKPLLIVKYDGHAAVANTALIQKLPLSIINNKGFNKNTGWFFQDAFYQVVSSLTKSVPIHKLLNDVSLASNYMIQKGIETIFPAEGVGFPFDMDIDFLRLISFLLPLHLRIYFQTMDIKKVLRRKLPCIGGCFATALDGCLGSEDAAFKSPYSNNSENKGILFYTQSEVNKFVKSAHEKGLQIALHAVGDAAVEQALNAFEEALIAFPRNNHRHTIIHADFMDSKMIEKASNLSVCIALQTPFLYWREEPLQYLTHILGNRVQQLIPLRSMISAGLILGNGSDAPCTIPDPISAIWAACNHPNSDEKIQPLDALKMHTNWGAKLAFEENEKGTLEIGKIANLVILDKNPLDMPVDKLKDIKIEEVYLSGQKYMNKNFSAFEMLFSEFKNKIQKFISRNA